MFLNLMSWTPAVKDATRTLWASPAVMKVSISEPASAVTDVTSSVLFAVRVSEPATAITNPTTKVLR